MSQNLLNLCQVGLIWSQNLLSLLVDLHQALHRILDLHHLKIDHLPHLQIQLKPDHLHHYHLILHLQNHPSLHQLVQVKPVPQILIQQFDHLLKQDQLKFYLIQDFMQFMFLKHLKRLHFKKSVVRLYISYINKYYKI